jgi:hypothetical protein
LFADWFTPIRPAHASQPAHPTAWRRSGAIYVGLPPVGLGQAGRIARTEAALAG